MNLAAGAAALALSGAAALIFQLLWIKQLSLVVGVDVYAVTTAVSAFFAGLALGSAIIGRRADRAAQPFRVYSGLELGIAVAGVAVTLALANAAAPFAAIEAHAGPVAWLMPFVLVGGPAVLMGGTIPVMVRALATGESEVARSGGLLYAANTAGAIAGALAAPFVLIPALGVRGSAFAAATLNVVSAFAVSVVAAGFQARETSDSHAGLKPRRHNARDEDGTAALRLYALAGSIALGYEIIWSQAIVQFISTRVFAFAIVLATYLAGLAIGSAVFARVAPAVRRPWHVFGLLVALAGLVAVVEMAALGRWLLSLESSVEQALRAMTGNELAAMCGRFSVAALGIVFVPTLLLGAAFPTALRLAGGPADPGRRTGAVLAWNTAGGIAGTLLTGFLLVPTLGLIRSLGVLAAGSAVVGTLAAWKQRDGRGRMAVALVAAASIAIAALTPMDQLARLLTASRSRGDVVFYAESAGGTVAVVQQQAGPATFRRLYIQGVSNSGDALTSLRYMRLQALLPLLIHRGEPKSALVIGLGTGITSGALLTWPGLDHRVCAELLPAVVQAAPLFHGNFNAASDSRLEIRVRDGRRELLRSDARYDVITLEPPPPSAQGVVNLYSRDFYDLARRRLQPNGILAQWWPLPTQNDEDSRALVRSFLDAFPQASLWTTELHEMLLVGSAEPIELDVARISSRFAQPGVADALSEVGVGSPAALTATWVTGRDRLADYAGDTEPVTDDRPRIEYATWTRRDEFTRVLPEVLALQSQPPLVNANEAFGRDVDIERADLRRFYEAGLQAARGDRAGAAALIEEVINRNPSNPYYRFVAGLPIN